MSLSPAQKKAFKAKAHHLDPVIIIGQKGVTQNVLDEIEIAIEHHELIKVKVNQHDKNDCEAFATKICEVLSAEFIGRIGKTLILYRKSEKASKNKD